jgi:hypothetical protein
MYNANLNYSQLKNHMDTLTSQGLLAKINKYLTTEKGYRFLELFAQLNDLLDEFTLEHFGALSTPKNGDNRPFIIPLNGKSCFIT